MIEIEIEFVQIEQLQHFGILLGKRLKANDVVCLGGDLGAGKTTLTQFIARGFGVAEKEYVTSPTFSIMHEYKGRLPLYHMDFYRLTGPDEILDLGFDEYFYNSGVSVIEWFKILGDYLPISRLEIKLQVVDENTRTLIMKCYGQEWSERLSDIVDSF